MLPGAPGSSMRQPSGSQSQQSSALSARIATKKAELENLRQLRDLSGTLAIQMQALDSKISTLKDGTEGLAYLSRDFDSTSPVANCTLCSLAVAYVLSNWDNVIRAITLASSKRYFFYHWNPITDLYPVIGKAGGLCEPESDIKNVEKSRNDLPSTLVRIPAEPRDKTGE